MALLVISVAAVVLTLVGLSRQHAASVKRSSELKQLATAKHAVSGRFPTTCSWCRETALARHMLLLERQQGGWRSIELASRIEGREPQDAAREARRLLVEISAEHRRLCSEKCVRDLLQSEGVSPRAIDFKACVYCGSSNLATAADCQHCGARHAA